MESPTGLFTIFEPRNQEIGDFVIKSCFKIVKGSVGSRDQQVMSWPVNQAG